MKEAPNQKVQEKKPLLKFKNTKKYMCLAGKNLEKKMFLSMSVGLLACLLKSIYDLNYFHQPWNIYGFAGLIINWTLYI